MNRKKLNYKLVLETGLHIGGQAEYEIAAIDNVVVKDPEGYPYIPGSSLKGKIRSLLETYKENEEFVFSKLDTIQKENNKAWYCSCGECAVCQAFGFGKGEKNRFSKVLFRDSFLAREVEYKDQIEKDVGFEVKFREGDKDPSHFLEVKMENSISRDTGKAFHPRQTERVVPGTVFDVKIVITEDVEIKDYSKKIEEIYENLDDKFKLKKGKPEDVLKLVLIGLSLLEDDYLGGSGTRGYGAVRFYRVE